MNDPLHLATRLKDSHRVKSIIRLILTPPPPYHSSSKRERGLKKREKKGDMYRFLRTLSDKPYLKFRDSDGYVFVC